MASNVGTAFPSTFFASQALNVGTSRYVLALKSESGRPCYTCKEVGHLAESCPKEVENTTTLDDGSLEQVLKLLFTNILLHLLIFQLLRFILIMIMGKSM